MADEETVKAVEKLSVQAAVRFLLPECLRGVGLTGFSRACRLRTTMTRTP